MWWLPLIRSLKPSLRSSTRRSLKQMFESEDPRSTRNKTGSAIPDYAHRHVCARVRTRHAESVRHLLPQHLHPILFNHRVRQHLMRDGFHVLLRLLPGHTVRDGDVEKLALAHVGDGGVPQSRQRGADGLALRIEHGGFQRDIYASFHETTIRGSARRRPSPRRCPAPALAEFPGRSEEHTSE